MTNEKRVWLALKGNETSLRLSEADGWEVHEVAKAAAPNSPEDIRQSMDLLQQINRESLSSNPKLRTVEPFHTEAHVTAEVFFARLGSPGIVVIQADTDDGPADVTLTPREAFDLMLWLQCALSMQPVETTDVLKTIYRLAGGHAIECQCRQCEIFELLEPIVGNSSRSAVDPPVAHKHWCAKLAPSVYTAMDCNCGAVEPIAPTDHVHSWDGDKCHYCKFPKRSYLALECERLAALAKDFDGFTSDTLQTLVARNRSAEKANDCTCGRQKTGDHEPGCTYRPDWL